MGEVIQIHVGQAGVQIANACWELYCLEHAIDADGTLCKRSCDDRFTAFFNMNESKKVTPRAVLVDSEPTVIDQIRTGPYGKLYSPNSLITGKEDSGSNFARGYYTMGAELIDITMEAIRTVSESCCNLKGFMIFRSIGGGTGSGLGNLIIEEIHQQYEKVPKLEFIIFPSPSISPLIVEPYNALLASHLAMDVIDCSCILDNEALYEICSAKLNICAPKYKNLNRIIGQMVSTFTSSQRFFGTSNVSFAEIQTNLVPYPRIHFPVVSYAPFIPGTLSGYPSFSTCQITHACFNPSSQLVRCNPADGKNMTCVLLYRGNVSSSSINASINQLRIDNTVRFVDWSPTGFKVGINPEAPFTIPGGGLGSSSRALAAFSNNTVIQKAWCRLINKYDRLFSRRSFIHHFIAEGLEEDALREASEDICTLVSDYLEVDTANTADSVPIHINADTESQGCRETDENESHSEMDRCDNRKSVHVHLQRRSTRRSTFCNEPQRDIPRLSHESLNESDLSPVRKSKSFEMDTSLKESENVEQRRSRSHELPKDTKHNHPKRKQAAHFGNDNCCRNTVRSISREHSSCRPRFLSQERSAQPSKKCGAGEVLRLPPIKREGTVCQSEAVIAKQRFTQSTRKPQAPPSIDSDCYDSCEMMHAKQDEKCHNPCHQACNPHPVEDDCSSLPADSVIDLGCEPCHTSSSDSFNSSFPCDPPYEVASINCSPPDRVTEKYTCFECEENPKCGPETNRTKCFCCINTDDDMYVGSDDFLPMCCRPPRCANGSRSGLCHQKQSRNVCGTTSNLLGTSCCYSYQEQELLCCPSNDRICECYPESAGMSQFSLMALPPPKTQLRITPSSSPKRTIPQIMFKLKEKKSKNKERKRLSKSK